MCLARGVKQKDNFSLIYFKAIPSKFSAPCFLCTYTQKLIPTCSCCYYHYLLLFCIAVSSQNVLTKYKGKKKSTNAQSLGFVNSKGQELRTTVEVTMQKNAESGRKILEFFCTLYYKSNRFLYQIAVDVRVHGWAFPVSLSPSNLIRRKTHQTSTGYFFLLF